MLGLLLLAATAASQPMSITAVRDAYPHLSPDGQALIFHSNRSGRQGIWISGADGGNPRLLFDGGQLGSDPGTPVWSPDGLSIAFAMKPAGATDENESEIYVMGRDGSGIHRLTTAPGDDSHPHWGTDGKRIFFNSARATPDLKADWTRQWIDIYSMAADGSDLRRHTECRAVCTYPVPSPDGRSVAHRKTLVAAGVNWARQPIERNSEIFLTALDGSSSVNLSNSPAYDGWPNWSPDGRWLVSFERSHRIWLYGEPGGPALASLPLPASALKQPDNGGLEAMATLPGGNLLLFSEELVKEEGAGVVWRQRGVWTGIGVAAATHALQNLGPGIAVAFG